MFLPMIPLFDISFVGNDARAWGISFCIHPLLKNIILGNRFLMYRGGVILDTTTPCHCMVPS